MQVFPSSTPNERSGRLGCTITVDCPNRSSLGRTRIGMRANAVRMPAFVLLLASAWAPQALAQETAREDDGEIAFDVTRVGSSDGEASVRYTTCPTTLTDAAVLAACGTLAGTATAGTDYTETSGTITFGDGDTRSKIPVPITDDDIDEQDETVHFVLFEGVGLEVPPESAVSVGTIYDDDPKPVLTASSPSAAEHVGDLDFTVNLDRASSRELAVPWKTVEQTATAGEDFTAANGTITFAPGSTSATVSVTVIDDDEIEPPESFDLEFTDIDHLTIGRGGVGTIEDNEVNEGAPWLVVEGGEVDETVAAIAFTLSLTHASTEAIVVEYETVDGTAKSMGGGVADMDYVDRSGSVTIQPAEISQTVFVDLRNDAVWEGDETLGLDILSADGTAGVVDGTATIIDDEERPTADNPSPRSELVVDEGIDQAIIDVELSHRSARELVFVATTDQYDALFVEDFVETSTAMTFAPGATSGQSVEVTVVDDAVEEPDEFFRVYFHEASQRWEEGELFWVKILDNDGPPLIEVNDAEVAEGDAMRFELELSHASSRETTVRFHTENGSAVGGRDYEASDRTLTIPALKTTHSVSVQTLMDQVDEIDEVFTVELTEPEGLEVGDGTARGTIIDDDPAPECHILDVSGEGGVRPCETCELAGGSAIESEGPITFTLAIVAESETTRLVQYATGDHTANNGSDYRARNGTLTIAAGDLEKTVSVPLIDDMVSEEVEQFRFGLIGCSPEGLDTEVFATIFDDDVIGVTVSIEDAEGNEDDGQLDFVVTLSESPTLEATVAYRTRDSSAVAGEDYTALDDVLTFAAGTGTEHTISVAVTDDTDIEAPREKFELVLIDPVNVVFAPGRRTTAVGTIIDDEVLPTLSVAPAEGPEGGTLGFPVTLGTASTVEVKVAYRFEDGTAHAGGDYDGTAGTVTFAVGATEQTVVVALEDNDLSESDETFTIEIHTPENAVVGTSKARGTIIDDEALPAIKREAAFSIVEGGSRRRRLEFETDSTRSEYPVKVRVYTVHGTAAGADYETFDHERTIKPAERTSADFEVKTKDDGVDEDDEVFDIHYSVVEGHVAAPREWTSRVTVTDDDLAPGVAIRGARAREGATAAFQVRLSAKSERTVSMRYRSEYGTATAADFEAVDATLQFAPGDTRGMIELLPLEDMLNEPDEETFKVKLSEVVNGSLARPTPVSPWFDDYAWDGVANGVIVDGDPSPQLTIGDQQVNEGDDDLTMSFEVAMDVAHHDVVRVNYVITEDTATQDDDYTSSDYSGQLTFAAGTTQRTIEVWAVGDDVPEGTETFEIELDHPRSVIIGLEPPYTFAKSTAVGTILDDDVHVSVTGARGREGETVSFVISVTGNPTGTVTVDYELRSGTATSGTDFQAASGNTTASLDFAVGETAKSVAVDLLTDGLDEHDEDFVLALTGAVGAKITTNEAEGVIEDVDDLPALAIADAVAVDEGEALAFVVSLAPASGRRVTVPYQTRDGTAVAGDDYTPVQATLTFEASETRHTVEVESIDDAVDELEENLHVVLGTARNATVDTTEGAGAINDNDDPPELSITGGRGVEGGEIEFSVSRSAASSQTITVRYATKDGTATALDYAETTGQLTFEPDGDATLPLPVALLVDDIDEVDEIFEVELSDAIGASVAATGATAEGVIEDGNAPPLLTVAEVRGVEGDVLTFQANLVGTSSHTVTVRYATDEAEVDELAGDAAAAAGDDFEPGDGEISFAPGQAMATVSVTTLDDAVHEIDEVFVLRFSDAVGIGIDAEYARGTIEDNEALPRVSIADAPDAPEDGTLVFDVTLVGASAQVVTVAYRVIDGTAEAGLDYVADEGVVEFQPGESAAAVEVSLIDDEIDEPGESLRVVLGDVQYATVDVAEATGTIIDNDAPPVLSITGGTGVEGSDVQFSVTMSGGSSQAVTVSYETADGTATASADYRPAMSVLTFAPGDGDVRTVPVALLTDNADEDDETFLMTLADPVGATLGDDSAEGTILDVNEPPLLSVEDGRGPEGGELAFELTLSGTSGRAVTVAYEFMDAGAVAGLDYEGDAGEVTIPPGESGVALSVTLLEDDIDEPDESFVMILSSPVNAGLADGIAVGWIEDNDEPPELSITDADPVEEGGTLAFTVSLTMASSHHVTVAYGTVDGTAVAGLDYQANRSVLTLAPGEREGTVEVAVLDDVLDEPDEHLAVKLSHPRNATLSRDSGSGSIIDNDAPPSLSVADAVGAEGTRITFEVELSATSAQRVEVDYATADGTALAGSDYEAASGTLVFAPLERLATVTIALPDDDVEEGDESFALSLSSPVNATVARVTATGTISDDDRTPVLAVDGGSGSEGETIEFEVARRGSTSRSATVDYATADGTAEAGADYEAVTGTLTFAVGDESLTVPVRLLDDAVDEPDESFSLTLSNGTNANISVGAAVGTIVDTDAAPGLSVTGDEDVEGGTVEFVVVLDRPSARSATVVYETRDGSAEVGVDYEFASGSLTFAPGDTVRTVAVSLLDDAIDEADETFALALASPVNATLATPSADATIVDNDASPALSIAGGRDVEGGGVDFVVTLDAGSTRPVTVRYATADKTALKDLDYEPVDGTLTFDAGDTRETVVVSLVDDSIDEPEETFAVALSFPENATLAVDSGDGVIIDDDAPPLLTVAEVRGVEGDVLTFQANLVGASSRTVTVRYAADEAEGEELAGHAAAAAGDDFEPGDGEISFAPGQAMATVSVTTLDDAVHEIDEVFVLRFSDAVGIGIDAEYARGTIEDNEALPRVSIADAPDAPEDGTLVFDVTLVGVSAQVVTVAYRVIDGTAEAGLDYVADEGVVEFQPGESAAAVEVSLIDDEIDEPGESLRVVLGDVQYATVDVAEATGTIIDNDAPPVLSITGGTGVEGSDVQFSVTMSGVSSQAVTVSYETADGTATASADYRPAMSVLTFAPGDGDVRTVPVALLTDNADEDDETFLMTLADPVGATLGDDSAEGTILDVNEPPLLSVEDGRGPEGGELAFELTLSGTSGRAVTVAYEFMDAGAVAGLDYEGDAGEVTIPPGESGVALSVTLLEDDIDEPDESFVMILSSPVNAGLADGIAAGWIEDNDEPPELSITDADPVEEGGTLAFTVSLTMASSHHVTVAYGTVDGTAVAGLDYQANRSVLTLAPGEREGTVEVALIDDEIDEPGESLRVVLGDVQYATVDVAEATGTIIDNDAPPVLSITGGTGVEGSDVQFSVTMSGVSSQAVTVSYETADGTATASADYRPAMSVLTFAPGDGDVRTVPVALLTDNADEDDETFLMTLADPVGATLGDDSAEGTILDVNEPPLLSVEDGRGPEGGELAFELTLSGTSGRAVTVAYEFMDAGAVAGLDYEGDAGEVTIPPGESGVALSVTLLEDDIDEPDESFVMILSSPVNAGLADGIAAGWIEDNDEPPELSITDADPVEEGGTLAFTVSLTMASSHDVTVAYGTVDGTAVAGVDYQANRGVLILAPGEREGTVEVAVLDDVLDEPDEHLAVKLSHPRNATLSRDSGSGSIIDNDAPPSLSVADAVGAEGTRITFEVELSATSAQRVEVDYATADGTALAGSDYEAASGTLVFAPLERLATVTIALPDDDVEEGDESFALSLSSPVNATVARVTATGTISDDDRTPVLAVDGGSGSEGETIEFEVARRGSTSRSATVDYATADGTAEAGADYEAVTGTLTFAVGDESLTVPVRLLDDAVDEPDESFSLTLSNGTNANISVGAAVGTIIDTDAAPGLSVTGDEGVEGGTVEFVVVLDRPSARSATVVYETRDGSAEVGVDYEFASGSLTFAPGDTVRTVAVSLLDDAIDEADETFALALASPVNATLATPSADATIVDNDASPALSIAGGRDVEGGGVDFVVTLDAGSTRPVTVRYATADKTALKDLDYEPVDGTLTFDAGDTRETVVVSLVDDSIDEPEETFAVALSFPENATLAVDSGDGVIIDDDAPPLLTVAEVRGVEGDVLTFQANLVGASSRTVTVRYAVDEAEGEELAGHAAAAAGDDFEPGDGEISFAPGQAMATVSVTTLDDAVHEIDEVFVLRFSDAVGIGIDAEYARGTIEDNEALPRVSIADAPDAPEDGTLVFDVTLVGVSARVVTVAYRVIDGTAEAGLDYVADEGVVEFQPGESAAAVEVSLIDDEIDEPGESLRVVLGDVQYATVDVAEATGTIVDNDAPPVLSITGGTGVEGSDVQFSVTMSGVSSQAVTVSYETADGTATASADYRPAMSVLTFAPGDGDVRTVPVALLTDNADEDDETFLMTLADPVGATLGDDSAEGTILDVNEPPLLSVEDGRGPEGGELAFELTLSGTSGRAVTVAYEFMDAGAVAGLDYEGDAGEVTIPPGESGVALSVTLLEDDIDEPDELFVMMLSSPVNAGLADDIAAGWIEDNDEPPELSITDADPVEEDGTLAFTVSLTMASSHDVTVAYGTVDGTAVAGVDYQANRGVLILAPGEREGTVEVAVLDDVLDEPDEHLAVKLSHPRNATLSRDSGSGSIIDNDAPPSLSVADAVGAEGTRITFEVELSATSAQRVEVDYATADGTALAGSDYEAASGTLVFAPLERLATVTIALPDDDVEEGDESFALSLSSPVNATVARVTATGTISDDDRTPVLAVDGGSGSEGETIEFEVARRGSTSRSATVDYATADGTAEAGADYEAVTGTLTFAVGDESLTVPVRLLDDAVDEPDESFSLTLSNGTNANISVGAAVGTIVDTDAAPGLSVTGDEDVEGGTVEFVVVLDRPSARSATVVYETRDGSAEVGVDYEFASGSLTFAPGDTVRTVAVSLLDDAIDEADETFALALASPVNATLATPSADATIVDNDASPALSIVGGRDVEGGGVDFVVTLDAGSTRPVTVRYATADKTALKDLDYEPVDGTLTFDAGDTRETVVVSLVDDSIDEPEETFAVALSSPENATLAVDSADGVIIDDDGAALLSVADAVATEGDGAVEFTISLDKPSGRAVTARFATADATAVDGEDYVAASGTLTIAASALETVVTVELRDDTAAEPNETFKLALSSAENAIFAREVAQGTILDDDQSAMLTVIGARAPEGGTANFEVRKSGTTTRSATVQYRTADGTASVHADYAFAGGTLTFARHDVSLTVAVALATDAIHEPDETFRLNLSSPEGAALAEDSAEGVILDRSDPPKLSIGDTSAVEGETAVFDVTAVGARRGAITVNFATGDGAALAGEDYESASGQLTFAPDDRSLQVAVRVLDDALDEPDETFSVVLYSPEGASLVDEEGTATVIDDDVSPVLRIVAAEGVEGGPIDFAVTLSGSSGQRVTVDYATSDGTAFTPQDYEAASGTLEFEPGVLERTITVRSIDDDLHEPTETMTATLSSASGANIAISGAEGLILDNDAPTLSIDDAGGFEGDALEFVVTVAGPTSLPVSVRYATADGTALAGADYVFGSGTLAFDAGVTTRTVTVTTLQDDLEEQDEAFAVTLSAPTNAALAGGRETAAGSIWDDDGLPQLTIADTSVGESGGEAVFRLSLSRAAPRELTVAYRTADGTAATGKDYSAAAGTLTFARGATAQTIAVAVIDDDLDEPDETFDLLLSDGVGMVLADGAAAAMIVDDDEAPTVSVADASTVESQGELRFEVTLSQASEREVTVAYRTVDGTAVAGADYAETTGQLTFAPGVSAGDVVVPVHDDSVGEADEEYLRLLMSVVRHATLADGDARGTILDDDLAPPSQLGELPRVDLCVGGAPGVLVLASYFGGDELVYEVESSDPDVAVVVVSDGVLSVLPVSEGEATLVVTATNAKGRTSASFVVLVVSDPAELAALESALAMIGGGHLGEVVSAVADRFGPQRDRLAAASRPVETIPGLSLVGPSGGHELFPAAPAPSTSAAAGLDWGQWSGPATPNAQRSMQRGVGTYAFSLADATDDDASWAFWGRGGTRRFQGSDEGEVRGWLAQAQVGLDRRFGDWLAGVSVAHSRGSADYRYTRTVDACGRPGEGKGELETEIDSVSPYAGAILERGWVWATVGFGRGTATLERCDSGRRDVVDLDLRLFALGGRHELGSDAPWSLSLLEEVGVAKLTTDEGITAIAGRSASAGRARVGVEAGHLRTQGAASVTTYVRANARGDWGDGGSGVGLELEAGARYRCDYRRLGATVSVRSLATHTASGYGEYGADASVSLLPKSNGTGFTLAVKSSVGDDATVPGGGSAGPWSLVPRTNGPQSMPWRLETNVGYGTHALGGLAEPFLAWDTGVSGRDVRFGVRYRFATGAERIATELAVGRGSILGTHIRLRCTASF